ncbi:MAG: APC family permease, partial [Armatimonadetes bacterium]|nr:APC family permease [Armatimonadota bacterium]
VTGLGGFLDAVKAVFTVYGGTVAPGGTATLAGAGRALGGLAALAFLMALLSSGSAWLMGADRILAVAAYDGAGPRALGRFSARFGTPIAVNLLSGVVATATMLAAFRFAHGSAEKYFSAAIALAISTETLSYLAIFPAFIRLRTVQARARRPYRVAGGRAGVWLCGGLTTVWALLASVGLIWPGFGIGWLGSGGNPDSALPGGFAHQRLEYELLQNVPLVLILLLGVTFYGLGRGTRAANLADEAALVRDE